MKLLLFLSGYMLLNTYAGPTNQPADQVQQWRTKWPTRREAWNKFKETCYGRCFNSEEFIEVFWKMSQVLQTLMANYMSQAPWETIAPQISPENLNNQCRVLNNTKACIENCSVPSSEVDQLHKAQSESIIDLLSRFCAPSIKSNYGCIVSVWKIESPVCNRRCNSFKRAAMEAVSRYRREHERKYETRENYDDLLRNALSTIGNYTCRFIHCRQNCRKPDIVSKCGQSGYSTTKELLRLIGDILQKLRDDIPSLTPTGRGAVPEMPEECIAERLAEEYI